MSTIYVRGAYGRHYDSPQSAEKDWDAGKDFFSVTDKCYCSIRDFPTLMDSVMVELNNGKICPLKIGVF